MSNKDKKNKTVNQDNELWNLVTKKDKKYEKANRVVSQNLESNKDIFIIKEPAEPKLIKKKGIKNNFSREAPIIKKNNINNQDLDPQNAPSGISTSQADKLKKGKIRPEKIFDLHGYTQFRAHNYINEELLKCYNKNIRSILIITGKKFGKSGAEGVLKKEVPRWLNLFPLRDIILMTSWATPRDGGEGALYVLLRRSREI
tara:strand:+ start:98 stop:700 length:603 start_codon:yes stop_codon:yes gene_type:complete